METRKRSPGVIKRQHVHLDATEARPGRTQLGSRDAAVGPSVRLVPLDGQNQAIEFTCSCGEVSLIQVHSEKKS